MVTIKEIAKYAGVSRGTVDRALNNKPGITDETRKKILAIAEDLNYKPNMIGKALALKNKIRLGFILEPIDNPFFEEIRAGVDKMVDELNQIGVKVDVYIMNSYEEKEQLTMIKQLRESGVNGIALTPIDSENVRLEVDACVEEGMKIVTCNTDIMLCKRTCFIGTNHEKSARIAAELLAKFVGGKGEFLVIIGYNYILAHNQRLKGFVEKINGEYPNIHIKGILEVKEDDKIALDETLKALERYPDINGIYIAGNGIQGVANAIKLKNKSNLINVISYDYAPYTVNLVKEGVIDAVIYQEPVKQGYMSLKILYDLIISGKEPENKVITTNIEIRLKENIDDIFGKREILN